MDDVLKEMKADKEFFQEPYEIPDNQRSFAIYELKYGHVFGLSTLHRYHDVIPIKRGENRSLKVHLAAGEINIKSSVKRKFLSLGRTANVDAKIPVVTMEFDIASKPDGSELRITSVKIDEVKGLTVKVSGSGIVRDALLNAFISAFGRFFQNAVKHAVENKMTDFLKDKVQEYTIPVECLNSF